jgi:hypothetical protein
VVEDEPEAAPPQRQHRRDAAQDAEDGIRIAEKAVENEVHVGRNVTASQPPAHYFGRRSMLPEDVTVIIRKFSRGRKVCEYRRRTELPDEYVAYLVSDGD